MTKKDLIKIQKAGCLLAITYDDIRGISSSVEIDIINYNKLLAHCNKHGKGNLSCCHLDYNIKR